MIKKILKNVGNMLVAVAILAVASLIANLATIPLVEHDFLCTASYAILYVVLAVVLTFIYSKYVLKMSAKELGLKLDPKRPCIGMFVLGQVLPFTVLVFYAFIIESETRSYGDMSVPASLLYGFFACGLGAGVVEELVFRGIIFHYMQKTLGTKVAFIVPAILFACVHIMNMETFNVVDLVLLILAGSSVSIMFTSMTYKSGSIWPNVFAHAVWNTYIIGGTFGIGAIVNGSANTSLIRILPYNTDKLLTGGNFGVEAALPAIIGYSLAAAIVLLCYKKKEK